MPFKTQLQTEGARQLRAWIDRAKLQHQEASALFMILPSMLSHYLNSDRKPTLDVAAKIEGITGIPARAWVTRSQAGAGELARISGDKSKVGNE